MRRLRVLLADDHALVLEGIKRLLKAEVELVGAVENGRALVATAHELKPDVILLDLSMPPLNGVEAARRLRKTLPGAKLIFLTMRGDPGYVAEALRVGASGYVLEHLASAELIQAIQQVVKGRTYVTPLAKELLDVCAARERPTGLTSRQREVLRLLAEGRPPKEIAAVMGISVRTVEFHKYSLMQKLGLRTIAELTKYAVRHRITEP